MILNAQQIMEAIGRGDIKIEPFEEKQIQPATYDLRVGEQGAATSTKKLINLREEGYLLLKPGDIAIVTVREKIALGPQHAGRIGLRSMYARRGLIATTGPQIDPGYKGRLFIGLINLTPTDVSIPYNDDLVSVEFHRLEEPTDRPYVGPYQGKTELGPEEIRMITEGPGMALSDVLSTLGAISQNVGALERNIGTFANKVDQITRDMDHLKWIIGIGLGALALLITVISVLFAFTASG